MTAVVLTIHTLIVLALIGVVLLQRSEGGALGMGGAGSGGGFMTGRGAANALTRTTSILAALFFATSLGLAMFSDQGESEDDVIQELTGGGAAETEQAPAELTAEDLLSTLGGGTDDPAESEASTDTVAPTEEDILQSLGTGEEPAPAAEPVEEAPTETPPQ